MAEQRAAQSGDDGRSGVPLTAQGRLQWRPVNAWDPRSPLPQVWARGRWNDTQAQRRQMQTTTRLRAADNARETDLPGVIGPVQRRAAEHRPATASPPLEQGIGAQDRPAVAPVAAGERLSGLPSAVVVAARAVAPLQSPSPSRSALQLYAVRPLSSMEAGMEARSESADGPGNLPVAPSAAFGARLRLSISTPRPAVSAVPTVGAAVIPAGQSSLPVTPSVPVAPLPPSALPRTTSLSIPTALPGRLPVVTAPVPAATGPSANETPPRVRAAAASHPATAERSGLSMPAAANSSAPGAPADVAEWLLAQKGPLTGMQLRPVAPAGHLSQHPSQPPLPGSFPPHPSPVGALPVRAQPVHAADWVGAMPQPSERAAPAPETQMPSKPQPPAPTAPPGDVNAGVNAGANAGVKVDVNALAEKVVQTLERRQRREQERKGYY